MSGEDRIPKGVHNDKMAEKRLISAWAENQWPVKLTEKLFEMQGHWLDDDAQEEFESQLDQLTSDLDALESQYETEEGGYDTDAIRSLDIQERKQISQQLYDNTEEAIDLFDDLYSTIEGHRDIEEQLVEIIDNSVRTVFQEVVENYDFSNGDTYVTTEVGDDTLNQIYNVVEHSIEANLEGIVDQETIDEVYDQLGDVYEEVVDQGRQTRRHTENQHEQTRNELHARFDEIEDMMSGNPDSPSYDSLADLIMEIADEYERSSEEIRSIREDRNEDTSSILYD